MIRGGEQAARTVIVVVAICLAAILIIQGARRLLARRESPAPPAATAASGAGGVYLRPPAPAPKYGDGATHAKGFEAASAIPAIAISRTGRPTVRITAPPAPKIPSDQ